MTILQSYHQTYMDNFKDLSKAEHIVRPIIANHLAGILLEAENNKMRHLVEKEVLKRFGCFGKTYLKWAQDALRLATNSF